MQISSSRVGHSMAKRTRGGRGRSRGGYGRGGRGNNGGGAAGGRLSGRGATRRRSYSRLDEPLPSNGQPKSVYPGSGVLEMHPNGYGFLRNPATNFTRERTDPFVPGTMIEKLGLRE